MSNHIKEAISLLDEIDGMPFGKVSRALDTLSTWLLLAQAEQERMLETLKDADSFFEGSENDGCQVHRSVIERIAQVKP